MWGRFRVLFSDVEIPVLYGASAIGTRLCIYTWNKETRRITPNAIPIDPDVTSYTAPAHGVKSDFLEVIHHIKVMLGWL